MFEDSLIESGGRLKTKRGLTTFLSFGFQIALVGVLVLVPLLFTEALPKTQLMTFLVAPPPPPPPPPPPAATPIKVVKMIQTDIINGQLRTPTKIPEKVQMIKEEEAPPPVSTMAGVVGGVPGAAGGQMGGVIGGIINSTPIAVPRVATPQRVRVSQGVTQGLLLRKIQPAYPPLARQARIQGSVLLQAEISKDGSIQNLRLISGHPMLAPAAIEAVKQWKYKPYILNGEPVEVETQITVNFTLAGG
jgi:periplasmic protein TonB